MKSKEECALLSSKQFSEFLLVPTGDLVKTHILNDIFEHQSLKSMATAKKKCDKVPIMLALEGVLNLLQELGSTGSVGQRFILLLADHPTLALHAVGASSRSAGKKYKNAVRWKLTKPMSSTLATLEVRECKPNQFLDCDLVFSGLDSDIAGDIGNISLKLLGIQITNISYRDGFYESRYSSILEC
jgi:Semialdehyde dehydrogenase, NAD binding domain